MKRHEPNLKKARTVCPRFFTDSKEEETSPAGYPVEQPHLLFFS
ncbi:hypothetical protein [Zongyangia hominis]|nr:hypothetical protein [Zongyangia hominis]